MNQTFNEGMPKVVVLCEEGYGLDLAFRTVFGKTYRRYRAMLPESYEWAKFHEWYLKKDQAKRAKYVSSELRERMHRAEKLDRQRLFRKGFLTRELF